MSSTQRIGAAFLSAAMACGVARLHAEDIDVNDVRLSLGTSPTVFKDKSPEVTSPAGALGYAPAKNASSNHREEVSFQHIAFGEGGGLLLGIDVAVQEEQFRNSDHTTDFDIPIGDLLCGYALRLDPHWDVEATIIAGAGRVSAGGLNQSGLKGAAAYYEYGVRLGAFWTMSDGLQFGVQLPYLITRTEPTYTYVQADGNPATVIENRRSIGGFAWLVSIGYRY